MELKDLYFKYDVSSKEFGTLAYTFEVISEKDTKEELANKIKFSLESLESILDNTYPVPKFVKKKTGEVTNSEIQVGYEYKTRRTKWDVFMNQVHFSPNTDLNYIVAVNSDGTPRALKMRLYNHDSDSKRKFAIYDSIITIPHIEFSEDAKNQIQRINFLKQEGFNVPSYLNLLQKA